MANMSYCRYQNTLGDLQDCREQLWEEDDEDLSLEELRAKIVLIDLCKDIAESVSEDDYALMVQKKEEKKSWQS